MNLTDILTGNDKNKLDHFADHYRNQTGFSSGASRISQTRYLLKRKKMEAGNGLMVVPLFLHIPISFDGVRLAEGMAYTGTFESAIKTIKYLCVNNNNYANAMKDFLGDKYDVLNLSDISTVSKEESNLFWGYRKPLVYAATVMTVKAADSKYAFGTPYRVTGLQMDPETKSYIDDVKNPLIYKLHRLETACIAAEIKRMTTENAAAGDAKRTEAELSQAIKNLWDNRCISNPYDLGTTRILWFKTDRNFEMDKSVLAEWKGDVSSIKAREFYIKVNRSILEQFETKIGTRYDRYADFLLIKETTPTFDEKTRGTAAQKISRTAAGSEEAIEASLDKFFEAYSEYRDDVDAWAENIMLKSAFEYRTISDDAIRTTFKNSMPALSAAMHTNEIVETYGEIIASLDSTLSDQLLESAMDGSLSTVGDISKEVAAAPVVTENTPGYGGDMIGDSEDSSALMDALVEE